MKKITIFILVLIFIPFILGQSQSGCTQRLGISNPRTAASIVSLMATSEVGILYNGGLENQTIDSVGNINIPGWFTLWSGADVVASETVKVHSGSFAISITKIDGQFGSFLYSGGPPECACIPWVRVFPGEKLTYEFWTSGAEGAYSIEDGGTGIEVVPITPTGQASADYFLVTGSFTVPADCYYIRIYLHAPAAGGMVYYDDIAIKTVL